MVLEDLQSTVGSFRQKKTQTQKVSSNFILDPTKVCRNQETGRYTKAEALKDQWSYQKRSYHARRNKERTYPELLRDWRCRLVVFGIEAGGRWSDEAAKGTRVPDFASARLSIRFRLLSVSFRSDYTYQCKTRGNNVRLQICRPNFAKRYE